MTSEDFTAETCLRRLRIPMRGYDATQAATDPTPQACYESPCGVITVPVSVLGIHVITLRIPLRGYDSRLYRLLVARRDVTNPHAGL